MPQFNFDIEFEKVYTDMQKFAYHYHLPDAEREDLLHETVLKILEKRHMFKIEGDYSFSKFRGWCFRIMNNIFINNYRFNKRRGLDSYDENPLLLFIDEPTTFSSDEELIFSELRDLINKTEKDEINRKIFWGYVNGMPYNSLADIFDLPLGTIKSRLFNTRKKIKQALKQLEL